jgi:hypothetical protein
MYLHSYPYAVGGALDLVWNTERDADDISAKSKRAILLTWIWLRKFD